MSLNCGIVGLPNVGKSTLFNALTSTQKAQSANYPFCTIEPNKGIVSVPDERLQALANIAGSKNILPTRLEFIDIAGLVKGASKGEGLGNQFLSNIRETDDYLVKPFSPSELIARVHALIRRRAPEYAGGTLTVGAVTLDSDARTARVDGAPISLRQVEFRLLKLFLAHPNRVFTRNEVLDRVWGENVFVEERTVDVHVRRVRLALGEKYRNLITTVRGGGYKLDPSLSATVPAIESALPALSH